MKILSLTLAFVLAAASADALFTQGQALYADLEYEKAHKKFTEALGADGAEVKAAEIHMWKGLCESGLGRVDDSRLSFKSALEADVGVVLPGHASPKVKEIFQEIRTEVQKAQAEAAQAARDANQNQVNSVDAPNGNGDVSHTQKGGGISTMGVLGVGLISAGAVVAITGGVFNGLAMQQLSYAQEPVRYQDEVLAAQDSANEQMLIAAIAYGAGGALIAAGAGMMFMGGGE